MAGRAVIDEAAQGLWTWTCTHPEWHPGEFGAEVRSWAARGNEGVLLLLDPLLPEQEVERETVLAQLDAEAGHRATKAISIQVSVGYHARSSEELWDRYRRGDAPVTVHGHDAVRRRLGKRVARDFREIEIGEEMPGGVVPMRIGKPKRQETPLHVKPHSALLFGDAIVTTDDGVRAWAHDPVDAKIEAFYRERFNPTVEPLIELGVERLLMTHGPPVLSDGSRALAEGIAAGPWYHHG